MIYVDAKQLSIESALGYAVAEGRPKILDFVSAPWIRIEPGEWRETMRYGVTIHPIVHRLDCPKEERS